MYISGQGLTTSDGNGRHCVDWVFPRFNRYHTVTFLQIDLSPNLCLIQADVAMYLGRRCFMCYLGCCDCAMVTLRHQEVGSKQGLSHCCRQFRFSSLSLRTGSLLPKCWLGSQPSRVFAGIASAL